MLTTIQALEDGRLRDTRRGWIVASVIALMAFGLRIAGLGFPSKIVFDETYYAKDAWGMLQSGYERQWASDEQFQTNDKIAQGDLSGLLPDPAYVVHPPLGKWLIALGENWFGMNAFGWRFMACVFGALLVFLTVLLARRLSRSTLVGAIAGVLLTFDGLAFTMSRIALLDIFQAVFCLAAVLALVVDRDWFRARLAAHLRKHDLTDLGGSFGPLLLWRPWRITAGLLFGAACAVKWNSVYLVAVFGIVTVAWDIGARALAGGGRLHVLTWRSWTAAVVLVGGATALLGGKVGYVMAALLVGTFAALVLYAHSVGMLRSLFVDAPMAFVSTVVLAVPVYIASWTGWLLTSGGYFRNWGEQNPDDLAVRLFGAPLGSLWKYHVSAYEFHVGDGMMVNATHTYEAHPLGWLVMARPIGIDAQNDIKPGEQGCEAVGDTCLRVISGAGTPLLWWMACAALVAGLWWWLGRRDWRFAVPVLGVLAVWLPWFQYAGRPLFFFYAVVLLPFYVTGLAMAMGRLLGPADGPKRQRNATLIGVAIALVVLNFAFMYPILTDGLLTRTQWLMRMWFGTWI
ncbi:MAG: phospholipid carrier-dependent glycosyltransferase [Propionibacteriaceae bacterium]|nr:phospholipid carrier-dependent glycosyltransferase [Propionibacteriaceae bacterium]